MVDGMKRILIAAAVLPLALAACGDDQDTSADPTTTHGATSSATTGESLAGDQAAVMAVAQEQSDRHSSGDYGGSWDMWTKDAKAKVSRDDYVAFSEACSAGGVPLKVKFVRFDNPKQAVVRLSIGDQAQSYTMKLEADGWAWQPQAGTVDTFANGLEAAKQARGC